MMSYEDRRLIYHAISDLYSTTYLTKLSNMLRRCRSTQFCCLEAPWLLGRVVTSLSCLLDNSVPFKPLPQLWNSLTQGV